MVDRCKVGEHFYSFNMSTNKCRGRARKSKGLWLLHMDLGCCIYTKLIIANFIQIQIHSLSLIVQEICWIAWQYKKGLLYGTKDENCAVLSCKLKLWCGGGREMPMGIKKSNILLSSFMCLLRNMKDKWQQKREECVATCSLWEEVKWFGGNVWF